VSIGQKNSTTSQLVNTLAAYGALEYTTIICANASDIPALKYIAPYCGITIAEE
jgi:F-type H+-transporting ATPase subunit alpha